MRSRNVIGSSALGCKYGKPPRSLDGSGPTATNLAGMSLVDGQMRDRMRQRARREKQQENKKAKDNKKGKYIRPRQKRLKCELCSLVAGRCRCHKLLKVKNPASLRKFVDFITDARQVIYKVSSFGDQQSFIMTLKHFDIQARKALGNRSSLEAKHLQSLGPNLAKCQYVATWCVLAATSQLPHVVHALMEECVTFDGWDLEKLYTALDAIGGDEDRQFFRGGQCPWQSLRDSQLRQRWYNELAEAILDNWEKISLQASFLRVLCSHHKTTSQGAFIQFQCDKCGRLTAPVYYRTSSPNQEVEGMYHLGSVLLPILAEANASAAKVCEQRFKKAIDEVSESSVSERRYPSSHRTQVGPKRDCWYLRLEQNTKVGNGFETAHRQATAAPADNDGQQSPAEGRSSDGNDGQNHSHFFSRLQKTPMAAAMTGLEDVD